MAAPTVTSVEQTLPAAGGPSSSGPRFESFKVVPASATDADISIPYASIRAISHLIGFLVSICQDAVITTASAEQYYFDQDLDATKNVIVLNSTNGAKVSRILADTGGALVSRTYLITLIGY